MDPAFEWRMWKQLKGAFGITKLHMVPVRDEMSSLTDVNQYDSMEDALDAAKGERAFLEPTGSSSLSDLPRGDIVLVLGNTQTHNLKQARPEETYRIATPNGTDLYGTNAAAIALAIRHGQ